MRVAETCTQILPHKNRLRYNGSVAVHDSSRWNQKSEEEYASGNREALIHTSDDWWNANLWTKSWWERSKWTRNEVWKCSFKMVMEWWFFKNSEGSYPRSSEVRTHAVVSTVCATGGDHALTCCTHIFLHTARSLRTSAHFHACHTQAWLKVMKKVFVACACLHTHDPFFFFVLAFLSLGTSRPTSPTHPSVRSCRTFPTQKRGSSALPHQRRAVWLLGQVRSPHRFLAQGVRWENFRGRWHDAHQRSRPQYLRLLENHTREHRTMRSSHSVWSLCFETLLMVILFFR